eukprot:7409545-Lingulodinium_polyedra.AAC.1
MVDSHFDHGLSGVASKGAQKAWARYEAEKLHMAMSYAVRLCRRGQFSRFAAVCRIKTLWEQTHEAHAPLPDYPTMDEGLEALEEDTDPVWSTQDAEDAQTKDSYGTCSGLGGEGTADSCAWPDYPHGPVEVNSSSSDADTAGTRHCSACPNHCCCTGPECSNAAEILAISAGSNGSIGTS